MIHYTPEQIEQQMTQMKAVASFVIILIVLYFLTPKNKKDDSSKF